MCALAEGQGRGLAADLYGPGEPGRMGNRHLVSRIRYGGEEYQEGPNARPDRGSPGKAHAR